MTKSGEVEKLELCPFDGRNAFLQENTSTSGSMVSWQVRCARCGVGGEVWGNKNKAIAAWNTRAPLAPGQQWQGLRAALESLLCVHSWLRSRLWLL